MMLLKKTELKKTYRIKKELSKMVGYRESKEYSRKSRVSDTYIRQIIEGKKEKAGYSIIDKLELFISRVNPEFEPSIENSLDIKSYSLDHLAGVANEIKNISNGLNRYCLSLIEMSRKQETDEDLFGNKIKPTDSLEGYIEHLSRLKNDIDSFWKVYVEGNLK
jgi:hypothetical protein